MFGRLGKRQDEADVLIVGAGPVGLCHALSLAGREERTVVVERRDGVEDRAEWVALDPESLSLLSKLDVLEDVEKLSAPIDRIVVDSSGRGASELSLRNLGVAHPRFLALRRSQFEALLEKHATAKGVEIHRNHRLRRLDIESECCRAEIEELATSGSHPARDIAQTAVEATGWLSARLVVGTDGRRSIVRRDLRAGFERLGNPRVNVVAECDGGPNLPGMVKVIVREQGTAIVWPVGSSGSRSLFICDPSDPEAQPGLEVDRQIGLGVDSIQPGTVSEGFIEHMSAAFGVQLERIVSSHALRYQPGRAKFFGEGPAWLSGAAAQIIAPVLGADENLGLREVSDLALLLGLGSNGAQGVPLLTTDDYTKRRIVLQEEGLGRGEAVQAAKSKFGWSEREASSIFSHLPILGRSRARLVSAVTRPSNLSEQPEPLPAPRRF